MLYNLRPMPKTELLSKDFGQCSPADLAKAKEEKGSCLVTTTHKPNLQNDRDEVAFITGRREWRTGTRFVDAAKYEKYKSTIEKLEGKGFLYTTVLNPA